LRKNLSDTQKNPINTNVLEDSTARSDLLGAAATKPPHLESGQIPFLSVERLQECSEYWKGVLADAPAILDLPMDRPRPIPRDHAGGVVPLELSEELTAKLDAFGQRHGATRLVILLAAWGALLARLSGQDEVVIGTRADNSGRDEIGPSTDSSVSTLALRLDLSSEQTVGTLIARVKARALEAERHRDLPFDQIVETLGLPRSAAHTPIFQAMFVWRSQDDVRSGPLSTVASRGDEGGRIAKFDLTLSLAEIGARIVGDLEYATALFDRETVERHAGYLHRLLGAMTEGDDQTIDRLPLFGEDERHKLLVEWNCIVNEYPSDKCVHQLFEAQVARTPDAVALVYGDTRLSYGELNARANRLAHHLRSQGIRPDDLVALCIERSLDMVIGLLAILKAGGAYVPLDPSSPIDRLAFALKDSAPKAALTHGLARETLNEAMVGLAAKPLILDLEADALLWADQPASDPDAASIGLTSQNLAYVIYTSGSTGLPKGCLLEHRNVSRLFSATNHWFHFNESDVWTLFHSVAFDFSVWEIWGALIYGGALVVVPRAIARSPLDFYELLRKEGVTVLNQTPSAFRQLIDAQGRGEAGHQLRYVIFGGEALELSSLKPWFADSQNKHAQLINMYGITETTVHVTYRQLTPADAENPGSSPIGRQIPDLRLYLLDRHGEPVPIGVSGEIYVGGAGVARGYLNRPDLTEQRFRPSPFVEGDRLYKAGDLGRYLPDGSIDFLGRNDFQVKIRGFRIELGEIEARLVEHQGVREAIVLAREDSPGEKRLVAYYLASAGADDIDPRSLRNHLLTTLPDYMVPAAYVRVDKFPLTGNGKLDRKALPAPQSDAYGARDYAAPEGGTEETLAQIWAAFLHREQVGRHDNFFELGGNSLLGVRLMFEINRTFSTNLALGALFAEPTIQGMARRLVDHTETPAMISLVPVYTSAPGTPLFMVHWHLPDLARHLGPIRPIYALSFGLPAMGRDISVSRPDRIEDLAAHYIEEMRTVQSHGPYYLIGHSVGGCIAFEMAQQLTEQGEEIAFLGLLDSYPAYHRLQAQPRLSPTKFLRNILSTPPKDLVRFGVSLIIRKLENIPFVGKTKDKFKSPDLILRRELISASSIPYEPKPYFGPVHLFQCETQYRYVLREGRPLPELSWQGLTPGGLTVKSLPVGHMELIEEPLVSLTAQAITDALNDLGKAAAS
jgi:amino acid adenylation domain-containing protein